MLTVCALWQAQELDTCVAYNYSIFSEHSKYETGIKLNSILFRLSKNSKNEIVDS